MPNLAAIALAVAAIVWAVAAWDFGRKWLAERSARELHKRQDQWEEKNAERIENCRKAVENLAAEFADEIKTLRAQQVGLVSGMAGQARPGRRMFP